MKHLLTKILFILLLVSMAIPSAMQANKSQKKSLIDLLKMTSKKRIKRTKQGAGLGIVVGLVGTAKEIQKVEIATGVVVATGGLIGLVAVGIVGAVLGTLEEIFLNTYGISKSNSAKSVKNSQEK